MNIKVAWFDNDPNATVAKQTLKLISKQIHVFRLSTTLLRIVRPLFRVDIVIGCVMRLWAWVCARTIKSAHCFSLCSCYKTNKYHPNQEFMQSNARAVSPSICLYITLTLNSGSLYAYPQQYHINFGSIRFPTVHWIPFSPFFFVSLFSTFATNHFLIICYTFALSALVCVSCNFPCCSVLFHSFSRLLNRFQNNNQLYEFDKINSSLMGQKEEEEETKNWKCGHFIGQHAKAATTRGREMQESRRAFVITEVTNVTNASVRCVHITCGAVPMCSLPSTAVCRLVLFTTSII